MIRPIALVPTQVRDLIWPAHSELGPGFNYSDESILLGE